jgi:prepilin peptidase CpaA
MALLVAVVVVAAGFDWRIRRIPNALNFAGIGAGLLLWLVAGSIRELLFAFGAAVAVIAAGMVLQAAGILGGGDVKLLGAVAAIGGPGFLGEALFWTVVAGVVAAMVILSRHRALLPLFRRLGGVARAALWRLEPEEPLIEGEGHRMPYGVVIAVGCVLAVIAGRAGVSVL